ncbi:xanthine dehydrogenase family protein molybdopterin-binding subunit [Kineobactrum sediminis]|uniref:Xanthine dehydrogenase family protein molybdopterin-binding subunit n=1 Tax=Kineobactrum sediminis TaxID=1905677 RepID=A0A2N5XY01_9GAMM|nr:xanthine dehydrogenase family protein molybdopterin-binding subunit [Kineobactrum sediminis]PLW81026.1 xanthine dehydrogenase family protein molybdopterin-binding subunit [Kineobactrum sediminis]
MADPAAPHSQAPVLRREARQKVTGRAHFTSDIELPGQLYAGILRSPHARARVRRIDASMVREVAGVRDVITHGDDPGIRWYGEEVPTFGEELRFVGDEVAAVTADSEESVWDGLRAFTIAYEVLEPVIGLAQAACANAPLVYRDKPGNLAAEPQVYCRGDVEAGFAAADVVVTGAWTTQTALHNALEPHGCNAWWDGELLNLWVSTQSIFTVRNNVARKLGLPLNRVRVHSQHIGGGFGAKQVDWKPTVIAAILARRSNRPVKLMLDREAESLAAGNRNATRQQLKLGATRDGRLCAISATIAIDGGAHTLGGENSMVAGCYQQLYACDNVYTEQRQYYSNTGPAVAFRAPGYVEGTAALEQAMDELATELQLDPFVLRERNYTARDQLRDKAYSSPDALRRCYSAAREAFNWPLRPTPQVARKCRGIGMAASVWPGGNSHPPAYTTLVVQGDGSVSLLTGAQDIGTGTRTVLAQVAAQVLELAPGRVEVVIGDTATELHAPPSAGSATLATLGPAVHTAATELRGQVLALAARELHADVETLRMDNGYVREAAGSRAVSLADLAAAAAPGSLRSSGAVLAKPGASSPCTFAVQCAEVEVDLDTAEITLLRLVCAPDCGAIVNRLLADSQVIGGVTQGLGFALTEERLVDEASGLVLNANLEDYLVPTVADVPPITHAIVDLPDYSENPLGVKGLGEPPIIATAPAIVNAVCDALGVRLRDLPLNRQRMLAALTQTARPS